MTSAVPGGLDSSKIEFLKLKAQFWDLARHFRETAHIHERLALLDEIAGLLDHINRNLDRQMEEEFSLSGLGLRRRPPKLDADDRG
jgi:hypothetical protein